MTSIRIFPRVVLLAYVLFLVYFLSHPLGFSYIALATSFCYVTVTYARASMSVKSASHMWLVWSLVAQFCMCALWNEHELPALQGGRISAAQPRQLEEAGVVNFGGESHPPCFPWHTCMPTFTLAMVAWWFGRPTSCAWLHQPARARRVPCCGRAC